MTTIDRPGVRVLFPGPLTSAQYFGLPETTLPMELVDGKVVMSPSPGAEHQKLVGKLFIALEAYAQRTGGEAFMVPMDVELAADLVLQPDVLYIAPGGAVRVDEHVHGPPDIVVEVLSPGTRAYDLNDKGPKCAAAGVREFWAVDPAARRITVLENVAGTFVERAGDAFGKPVPSAIAPVGDAGLARHAEER